MKLFSILVVFSIFFYSCASPINKETAAKTASVIMMTNHLSSSSIRTIISNTLAFARETGDCVFETNQTCSGTCYNGEGTYTFTIEDYMSEEKFVASYEYNNCKQPLSFCEQYNGTIPTIIVNGTMKETTIATETTWSTTQTGSISVNNSASCDLDMKISGPMDADSPEDVTFEGTICSYTYQELQAQLNDLEALCSE